MIGETLIVLFSRPTDWSYLYTTIINVNITIDILFILTFNLPIIVVYFVYFENAPEYISVFSNYFLFLSFSINFYFFLITNSLFRNEFLRIFCAKNNSNDADDENNIELRVISVTRD